MGIEETVEKENQKTNTNEIAIDTSVEKSEDASTSDEIVAQETENTDTSAEVATEETNTETGTTNSIEQAASGMSTSYIALSSVHIILSLVLIFVVLQQSKSASSLSLGSEGSQTYWSKNKGRSSESKLAKITVFLAIILFILTLTLNFIG